MPKPKLKKLNSDRPVISTYAKKKAEVQAGTRPPFQFVERDKSFLGGQASQPSAIKNSPIKDVTIEDGAIVIASIIRWAGEYFFLQTENGLQLFLSIGVLQRSPFNHKVNVGSVLECRIKPNLDGKAPKVTKILSILPTP